MRRGRPGPSRSSMRTMRRCSLLDAWGGRYGGLWRGSIGGSTITQRRPMETSGLLPSLLPSTTPLQCSCRPSTTCASPRRFLRRLLSKTPSPSWQTLCGSLHFGTEIRYVSNRDPASRRAYRIRGSLVHVPKSAEISRNLLPRLRQAVSAPAPHSQALGERRTFSSMTRLSGDET